MPNPDRLVSSLSCYFDADLLPPKLGSDLYGLVWRRLRYEGYPDRFHVEEVFSMALINALRHLCQHGGANIRQPLAWFRVLWLRACIDYLKALAVHRRHNLLPLLEGEILFFDTTLTEERTLAAIRRAVKRLRPRHRKLVVLELLERLPSAEIEAAMRLPSNGAFRKLKHEAFRALRDALVHDLGEPGSAGLSSFSEPRNRFVQRSTDLAATKCDHGTAPTGDSRRAQPQLWLATFECNLVHGPCDEHGAAPAPETVDDKQEILPPAGAEILVTPRRQGPDHLAHRAAQEHLGA
jgi:DNA-directed RNA polymerase specialized sigma24 family protein